MTPRVSFKREPDPAAGVRQYRVLDAESLTDLGWVTNRQGNWWRAFTPDGRTAGSFHYTRKDAVAALLRADTARQVTGR